MWWAWMLAGAGAVILAEAAVVCIFGFCLGKEIVEERERENNIFYPADQAEEKY